MKLAGKGRYLGLERHRLREIRESRDAEYLLGENTTPGRHVGVEVEVGTLEKEKGTRT
jgi:hypothetical protein